MRVEVILELKWQSMREEVILKGDSSAEMAANEGRGDFWCRNGDQQGVLASKWW